ncbi:hypothetical protein [Candidatus Poriferisodalis sp.]|uniref:hypothetical protein n=1 Tax=Candidatus Poriferisodalis sp. TaxID=3101277 RepID=UPI003B5BD4A0
MDPRAEPEAASATDDDESATEGGETKVAIEVRFDGYVQTVDHDQRGHAACGA